MKRFPAKLKARGYRELPYKLNEYILSAEFTTVEKYVYLDIMQSAMFLINALHRPAWDYKTFSKPEMFDIFERHFDQLAPDLSVAVQGSSIADLYFDALDYLIADRYLIEWKNPKTKEPEFILHAQHSILGTPDEVAERFGNYRDEKVQTEIMREWLKSHQEVKRNSEAVTGYNFGKPSSYSSHQHNTIDDSFDPMSLL